MSAGRDPLADAGDIYRQGNDVSGTKGNPLAYPTTHEGWIKRYDWLAAGYLGEPYTVKAIRSLGLFRALDEEGLVIAETKRLTRDIAFVVDCDAQALGGELDLDLDVEGDPTPQQEADFEIAKAIWTRSDVQVEGLRWATICASLGDLMVEVVAMNPTPPHNVMLVAHDPRHCFLVKDEVTGRALKQATITLHYVDPPKLDENGNATAPPVEHQYRRVLTPEEVTVYRDGSRVEEESAPTKVKTVTLVHLPFRLYVHPEHGLWAGQGLEGSLALVDSLLSQLQAIGNRYGNPMLVVKGAVMSAGTDASKMGRILSGIPEGGSIDYLEADLPAIRTLLETAMQEHDSVRATLPEFLFTESGANSSGDALNFRATSFEAKMRAVRTRWYAGLARAMEIAVAMEKGEAFDEDYNWLRVSGGPILPVNVSKELESIGKAHESGGLLDRDLVGHFQRLGITPPAEDPEVYSDLVKAEQGVKRDAEAGALSTMFGGGERPDDETGEMDFGPEAMDDEAEVIDVQAGAEKVADTALNGAQVTAAQGIVESVAAGALPRETGIEMLVQFFQIDKAAADRLMGTVGATFKPATEEAAPTAAKMSEAPPE